MADRASWSDYQLANRASSSDYQSADSGVANGLANGESSSNYQLADSGFGGLMRWPTGEVQVTTSQLTASAKQPGGFTHIDW